MEIIRSLDVSAKARRLRAWIWVALCVLAIFLTIPVARAVQSFAFKQGGKNVFSILLLAVAAGALIAAGCILFVRLRIRRPARYLWLVVCAASYAVVTFHYWSGAVEAAHFLEYGFLGVLLFKAWRFSIPGKGVYLAAFLSGALIGTIDEIIQWVVPARYFDFRDIGINAFGVGIVLLALWLVIRPALTTSRGNIHPARRISSLFAANLILIGICLSNTPERTAALAARLPFLAPLEKEEPMHDFIIAHRDTDIGVFYSRLTIEWFKKADLLGAVTNGQILREWRNRDYAEFLARYNQTWTPFLYEMRIHVFRRDKYDAGGAAAKSDNGRRRARFVAAKENLILEKYFAGTLAESGYAWPAEKRKTMSAAVDLSLSYESPVSKGFLSGLSLGMLWILILGSLLALATLNLVLERKTKRLSRVSSDQSP